MSYPVALIDVDNALVRQRDEEKEWNTGLLDSLRKQGIKDVYLLTATTFEKDTVAEYLALINFLREDGFTVHEVITPMDLVWRRKTDKLERVQDALRFSDLENHQDLADLQKAPLKDMVPGIAFSEVVEIDTSNPTEEEKSITASRVKGAHWLAKHRARQANHENIKTLLLEAFMAGKSADVSSIVVADSDSIDIPELPDTYISRIHTPVDRVNAEQYDDHFQKRFDNEIAALTALAKELQLQDHKPLQDLSNQIFKVIGDIRAVQHTPEFESIENLHELTNVLYLVNQTLKYRNDPEKLPQQAKILADLSTRISGKPSTAWKALGISLLVLACSALVAIGLLAAIPTGGSSLILLAAIGSVAAGLAGTAATYHGTKRGLAKSVGLFGKSLLLAAEEESPFKVDEPNNGDSNIRADWNRAAALASTVDGVDISDLLPKDSDGKQNVFFKTDADVETFVKKHLLKNVPENLQDKALKSIMPVFHQGGLLHPASSAAATFIGLVMFKDDSCEYRLLVKAVNPLAPANSDAQPQQIEVHFKTTAKGFSVQETIIQRELGQYSDDDDADIEATIAPDPGNQYVYKARAIIDVNFDENGDYELVVKNNTIKYGSKRIRDAVQEHLDPAPPEVAP